MSPDAPCHGDTSVAIVLQWLEQGGNPEEYAFVTNNHFDIDGFIGTWCLLHPEEAMQKASVFRQAALIGDFRETDPGHPATEEALRIVCWINQVEKQQFYPPFGESREERTCIPKFVYFLEHFGDFLADPMAYREQWQEEYETVQRDLAVWSSEDTTICDMGDIRLRIIRTPQPLHYYALFAQTQHCDMVLSQYAGQRYELEYKYSTWVDTTRLSYPRLNMKLLATLLQEREGAGCHWQANDIADSGPILRLTEKGSLSKELRFDSPANREILSSSINPDVFKRAIVSYYREHLIGIQAKRYWTWEEMRALVPSVP